MKTIQFEGYSLLSDPEKKAFDLLQNVDHDSIWGVAIRNVCARPNAWNFRSLVCQLKSQAIDCPETMKNILGDAYESIVSL